jgi:hypothetical protein
MPLIKCGKIGIYKPLRAKGQKKITLCRRESKTIIYYAEIY